MKKIATSKYKSLGSYRLSNTKEKQCTYSYYRGCEKPIIKVEIIDEEGNLVKETHECKRCFNLNLKEDVPMSSRASHILFSINAEIARNKRGL